MRRLLLLLIILSYLGCRGQNSSPEMPGTIAPELVGNWCIVNPAANSTGIKTNSCIILNADGSYEIHLDRMGSVNANAFLSIFQESDYGKWWVMDSRIYYSSTARGTGSFRLQKMNRPRIENTPAIVLDGIVFCSAGGHDPW